MGIVMLLNAEKDLLKILKRHIRMDAGNLAITATVSAAKVAAQGTLPEELPQGVLLSLRPDNLAVDIQRKALLQIHDYFLLGASISSSGWRREDAESSRATTIATIARPIKIYSAPTAAATSEL